MYRSFGLYARVYSGRGALYKGRSHTERSGGLYTRENAGISSESTVRICAAENLRFPGEGSSAQGKSGPKARLNKRSRWEAGKRFLHYRNAIYNIS